MRTVNTASVVFTLIDNYDKSPVNDAIIYCDKEHIPYVKKSNGNYVFLNLTEGKHSFIIRSNGFLPFLCDVDVSSKETEVVVAPLNYARDNKKLLGKKKLVFRLTENGGMIRNENVTIRLDSKVTFLRVIKAVKKGEKSVKINLDYNSYLLFQEFEYGVKTKRIMIFNGYDPKKEEYTTEEECISIADGNMLKPIWNIRANSFGEAILAVNNFYMQKDDVELTIMYNGHKEQVKLDVSNNRDISIDFKS